MALSITHHVYYKRKHATSDVWTDNVISTPKKLDWTIIFHPLLKYLTDEHYKKQMNDEANTVGLTKPKAKKPQGDATQEQIKEIGAKVKIYWTANEIGDSGWKPGWYTAQCNNTIL